MDGSIPLTTGTVIVYNTTWTNGSETETEAFETQVPQSHSLRTVEIIQLTVSIIGIIANVVSITATCHVPHDRWTAYNKLIINLGISDIFLPMAYITHLITVALKSEDSCSQTVQRFILNVTLTSTLFNLLLMAVGHYIAIIHAIRYRLFFSKARVNFGICFIWGVSVAFGVFEILVSFGGYTDDVAKEVSFCHHVNFDDFNYELVIIIFLFVVLVCLIVIYAIICVHVMKMIHRDKKEGRWSNSYKATFTTFLIIGSFVICWCPLGLFHLALYIKPPTQDDDLELLFVLNDALFALMLFNSICDPVIYGIRRSEVKQGYTRMFRNIVRSSVLLDRDSSVFYRRRSTGTGDTTYIARLSLSSRGAMNEK